MTIFIKTYIFGGREKERKEGRKGGREEGRKGGREKGGRKEGREEGSLIPFKTKYQCSRKRLTPKNHKIQNVSMVGSW